MFLELLPFIALIYAVGCYLTFVWILKIEAKDSRRASGIELGPVLGWAIFWFVFWPICLFVCLFDWLSSSIKNRAYKRWGDKS